MNDKWWIMREMMNEIRNEKWDIINCDKCGGKGTVNFVHIRGYMKFLYVYNSLRVINM